AGPNEPVWLEMVPPYGYLPVVPWERLVSPHLQRPVLWLPPLSLQPFADRRSPTVALCIALPEAVGAEGRDLLVRSVLRAHDTETWPHVVHVFADPWSLEALERFFPGRQVGRLQIHPPWEGRFSERGGGMSPTPEERDGPWLRWVSDRLQGQAV